MTHLQEIVSQASDLETLSRSPSAEFSSAAAPGKNESESYPFFQFNLALLCFFFISSHNILIGFVDLFQLCISQKTQHMNDSYHLQ